MSSHNIKTTLVIGLGDPHEPNDAIVLSAIDKSREMLKVIFPKTSFRLCNCGGFDLLDQLDSFQTALIVDRVQTSSFPNGTIHQFCLNDLQETHQPRLVNTPSVTLSRVIDIGRMCNLQMPAQTQIAGIEINNLIQVSQQEKEQMIEAVVEYVEWFLYQQFSPSVKYLLDNSRESVNDLVCMASNSF